MSLEEAGKAVISEGLAKGREALENLSEKLREAFDTRTEEQRDWDKEQERKEEEERKEWRTPPIG